MNIREVWLFPAGDSVDQSAPVTATPETSSREILPDFNLPVRLFHNCQVSSAAPAGEPVYVATAGLQSFQQDPEVDYKRLH